jgi:opacity protein-like surface antigen
MFKQAFLLAIMVTVLNVTLAHAQGQGSFGPQLGYQKARDADTGQFMGGLALRLSSMPIGVEGSINYRQERFADRGLTVRSWPVMVTGLIYPVPVAYGAVGVGWYNTTFDYDQNRFPSFQDETRQKFGWHFGGGVEFPMSTHFRLAGDIRYVFLDYDFPQIPGTGDMKSDFYVITVGFLFTPGAR